MTLSALPKSSLSEAISTCLVKSPSAISQARDALERMPLAKAIIEEPTSSSSLRAPYNSQVLQSSPLEALGHCLSRAKEPLSTQQGPTMPKLLQSFWPQFFILEQSTSMPTGKSISVCPKLNSPIALDIFRSGLEILLATK